MLATHREQGRMDKTQPAGRVHNVTHARAASCIHKQTITINVHGEQWKRIALCFIITDRAQAWRQKDRYNAVYPASHADMKIHKRAQVMRKIEIWTELILPLPMF